MFFSREKRKTKQILSKKMMVDLNKEVLLSYPNSIISFEILDDEIYGEFHKKEDKIFFIVNGKLDFHCKRMVLATLYVLFKSGNYKDGFVLQKKHFSGEDLLIGAGILRKARAILLPFDLFKELMDSESMLENSLLSNIFGIPEDQVFFYKNEMGFV